VTKLRAPSPIPLSQVVARLRAGELVREAPLEDPLLEGVTADSRTVLPGDLFCAWTGTRRDAHVFVGAAAEAGAVAAVVERPVEASIPQVVVADGREAAALASDEVMGRPGEALILAGVTGTNGKTTTVWILRHLMSARYATASLGTVGAVLRDGVPLPGTESLTTPGPVGMAATMRSFVDHGTEAVALEVSSHAIDQGRVRGLRFAAAVFTNLSRDHLDYHGSLERYRATKRDFIELLAPDGVAVINADDPAWDGLDRRAAAVVRFALEGGRGEASAEVLARDMVQTAAGSRFRLVSPRGEAQIQFPLPGAYNVQNALAAAGAVLGLGFEVEEVAAGLASAPQVPGRLERVSSWPCPVFTDYAHTPDALERVLSSLGAITRGRVIVVFGAGGDRDAGKRPLMGAVAGRLADVVVVTSDNPRTEDPEAIIDQIVTGTDRQDLVRITDRRAAIERALEMAEPEDLVLLAGKGHETFQVLATGTISFNERAIVAEWVARKGGGTG
jgi:UDP-N-acetylmuramoyl-L-alanyl-D-glutamate--2,6-diaminopimelate ligase